MVSDVICMQMAFIISYIIQFGMGNPYADNDYCTLVIVSLFIDFFMKSVADAFKNVLKREDFDEFVATSKHVILVELVVTFYLFSIQMGENYSRISCHIHIMVPP